MTIVSARIYNAPIVPSCMAAWQPAWAFEHDQLAASSSLYTNTNINYFLSTVNSQGFCCMGAYYVAQYVLWQNYSISIYILYYIIIHTLIPASPPQLFSPPDLRPGGNNATCISPDNLLFGRICFDVRSCIHRWLLHSTGKSFDWGPDTQIITPTHTYFSLCS